MVQLQEVVLEVAVSCTHTTWRKDRPRPQLLYSPSVTTRRPGPNRGKRLNLGIKTTAQPLT